jgi:GST-like protein
MWTLFGSSGSGSAAVEAALLRCDVPFRRVVASAWEPGPGLDELLRANPLGQIPTLKFDDGRVMTESAAILIHLGLAHPASGLLPDHEADRAQAIRGLVYIAANCYAAIGVNDYPERWLPDGDEADQLRLRKGARARLHQLWDHFADQFPLPPPRAAFYAGTRPGALDLLAAVVSRWSGARAHLLEHRPALAALVQRVDEDAEFRDLFLTHWPARAAA